MEGSWRLNCSGWPEFRPKERRIADFNTSALNRVVGHYKFSNGLMRVVTRSGNQLTMRSIAMAPQQIFPENKDIFFTTQSDVEFAFAGETRGRADRLVMRQGGQEKIGLRIDDADQSAIGMDMAFRRIDRGQRDPNSESALRENLDGLRRGEPNYARMSPGLADATRQSLPGLQSTLERLGTVLAVKFKRVTPEGSDVYDVVFQNGQMEWSVACAPDGLLIYRGFR